MSNYQPWKALERRHAKRMCGKRLWRPDYAESIPDGENDVEVWDCKALSGQRIVSLFEECRRKYREYANGRYFHLCLFDPKRPRVGDLVVIPADRFAELVSNQRSGRIVHHDLTEDALAALREKAALADGMLGAITEFDAPR